MTCWALALGLLLPVYSQSSGEVAGLGILRTLHHLLRSVSLHPSAEARADARSGCPAPRPNQYRIDRYPIVSAFCNTQGQLPVGRYLMLATSCLRSDGGEPQEWDARSARQHLPADLVTCRASVASASARGGRSVPEANPTPSPKKVLPVLTFPEPGIDDTAAYQGYQTRFYRDSKANTVQIYLEPRGGRAVLVWADGANESAGFTLRDQHGRPARVTWQSEPAFIAELGTTRS